MRFRFRLSGELEGQTVGFDLEDGEHRVGSSVESDVRLVYPGVSRRHAVLRVLPGGVSVEDSGSRNGTFVDGSRVQKAAVDESATLAFGPVELSLQILEGGEAVAGILLEPPLEARLETGSSLLAEVETPLLGTPFRGAEGGLLACIETVLDLLRSPSGRSAALAVVAEGCGADGAWLAHWPASGEPAVSLAHGEPPALPARARVDAALRAQRVGELRWQGDRGGYEMVSVAEAGGGVSGLIVGDLSAPGPPPAFLRVCLRILQRPAVLAAGAADEPRWPRGRRRPGRRRLVFPADHVPGTGAGMEALYAELEMALGTDLPLLFLGETGVGKDQLVKIFHASSQRSERPLVALNCAAITADLFEAELFGTVRGAATGVEARIGAVRRADKGTLFLDEVGEMPLRHQAKLLRALQEREVQPVGSDRAHPVDIRVLAATNQDLSQRVAEGCFRRDLFYRLSGHVVTVPPLRHRRGDLPRMIELFARRAVRTHGTPVLGFSAAALRSLMRYPWPGNVRQLETEIQRLVIACAVSGGRRLIDVGLLPEHLLSPEGVPVPERGSSSERFPSSEQAGDARSLTRDEVDADAKLQTATTEDLHLPSRVEALERRMIREALRRSGGNRSGAARILGIHRNGLRMKMNRLGLEVEGSVA